jgi:inner membrane protein import complex subunit Tim44-like protein
MRGRLAWRLSVVGIAVIATMLWVSRADARPGSGQSYSSGSSSGSSGGSSGGGGGSSGGGSRSSSDDHRSGSSTSGARTVAGTDGSPVLFLVLFFGLLLFCGGAIVMNVIRSAQDRKDYVAMQRRRREYLERESRADYVAMIREKDPEFSLALFEDFARALFTRAQLSRHDDAALARLAPYLSAHARKELRNPDEVETVIIGVMMVKGWNFNELSYRFVAAVEFQANLVLAGDTHLVHEIWTIERSSRARTRPWQGVRVFGCPSCGAPLEQVSEELCAACGQEVRVGGFDWTVTKVDRRLSLRTGISLTGTVPEQGTDAPTIVHSGLEAEKAALLADDPMALTGLEARLGLIFAELNAAWAAEDLHGARPYLSSGLFATLRQQVQTYVAQGLVNVVDGARIVRWETTKLARDARYDALTVRLFGSGRDYTYRKATREVVGGDDKVDRPYSEYWTLIRGSKARGAPRADKSCPRCAAPLAVGMEGNCEHCGALVTSGDFDWILSGIEQDDAYRG